MIEVVQGSAEWYSLRCGKVGASRVKDVIAKTKTGYSAYREHYLMELLAERLTGNAAEHYVSSYMDWGTAYEADAAAAYEFYRDVTVEPGGYAPHPEITMAGASPDRFVAGTSGLLEIKCPKTETHLATLLADEIPPEHEPQMLFQMACTGCTWVDFVSFDPRLPEEQRTFIRRFQRNDVRIKEIEEEVCRFLYELGERHERLMGLDSARAA